jgi:hypothetical protein
VDYALKVVACHKRRADTFVYLLGILPVPVRYSFWFELAMGQGWHSRRVSDWLHGPYVLYYGCSHPGVGLVTCSILAVINLCSDCKMT